jgi:hypothetical protein
VRFWSRGLPAKSIAPVVTTALYLVLFAKRVAEVPNGLSVALRPSVLGVTVTSVIRVVLPSGLTLKRLKVSAFMEEALICSEKVAVRSVAGLTSVALAAGMVLMTRGGVVSPHSAFRQASLEQSLKLLRRACAQAPRSLRDRRGPMIPLSLPGTTAAPTSREGWPNSSGEH